jgi:hypothetical protein
MKFGITEGVVLATLLIVAQDSVGFADFFEFFLGLFIALIAIGMVFEGELAIGFFDVVGASPALYLEYFVVICHRKFPPPSTWILLNSSLRLLDVRRNHFYQSKA